MPIMCFFVPMVIATGMPMPTVMGMPVTMCTGTSTIGKHASWLWFRWLMRPQTNSLNHGHFCFFPSPEFAFSKMKLREKVLESAFWEMNLFKATLEQSTNNFVLWSNLQTILIFDSCTLGISGSHCESRDQFSLTTITLSRPNKKLLHSFLVKEQQGSLMGKFLAK